MVQETKEIRATTYVNNLTGETRTIAYFQKIRVAHRGNGKHSDSYNCKCKPIVRDVNDSNNSRN